MEFSQEQLVQMLKDGVTADDIVKAFADALNAAQAKASAENEKKADFKALIDQVVVFVNKYYPEMSTSFTDEEVYSLLDEIDEAVEFLAAVMKR